MQVLYMITYKGHDINFENTVFDYVKKKKIVFFFFKVAVLVQGF